MHDSNWQAEKKKILTRLSIAIYKMTDEQVVSMFHLFKDLELKGKERLLEMPRSMADSGISGARDRQLLIARIFLLINQLSEADLFRFMNRYEQKRFAMLREYPRVPCNLTLDLAADGRAINCFAVDISAGGMFVESCEPFTMGQEVSICFSLTEDHLALKLKGRVVRLEHGGVGIKFESLTSYQIEIMKDLIARLHSMASSRFRLA
jgi:Tfp pilus assembly protein PilZ